MIHDNKAFLENLKKHNADLDTILKKLDSYRYFLWQVSRKTNRLSHELHTLEKLLPKQELL